MHKSLVDFKVTWKILTRLRLNYYFQTAHSQLIAQLVFVVIQREKVISTSAVL